MWCLFVFLLCLSLIKTSPLYPNEIGDRNFSKTNDFLVRHDLDNSLFDLHPKYCKKEAKCQPLNYTTCMGAKLPYTSTTLELTDLTSQEKVQEKLHLFHQYLPYVPKCWAVIQPFLCALYMPKCDNGMVDLPSREMCRITLGPCKIFYNSSIFPKFLNCENDQVFPSKCKNDVHELKFNTTGFCMEPLVKTDQPDWFYPDVEGCGLRCKDSLYTENEHYQIQKLIAYCVLLCSFCTLFTIITFIIDWNTANKYPALTIFYMNVCFFISYSGWSIQFLGSETREDIVCKKDGTLRKSEPSATENLSCVIVFVMVYYFLIAGMVWFVIFSYTWHMSSLQALGKIQERVDKKRAYFHLVAWSLPLILTITTMALGEIDGDYVTGICFVGMVSFAAKSGLLLAPLAAAMIAAGYITVRGLILLIKVKMDSKEIISEHSSRKIRSNIVRMGVFTIFMLVFCIITFIYHGYLFSNSAAWNTSLHSHIICKLTSLSSDFSHCKQEARPSVAMLQLQLLAVFGAGVAVASWVWCGATLHSWTRYIRNLRLPCRKFRCERDEPIKLQKHKIIAQAFSKRKKFNEGGRISIDCQNYTDPVGLHFDLNSYLSNGLSTTWAANLPRLVSRRGAVVNEMNNYCYNSGGGAGGASSNNHSAVDSEVSLNVRHVSIESRCNSGDSQLSVQIAELKATRKVNSRRHRNRTRRPSRHHDFRRTNSRSDIVAGSSTRARRTPSKSNGTAKRESSTSLDSHLRLINALTNTGDLKNMAAAEPNLKRRTGNAGLDGQPNLKNLLANGKLVIPYCNLKMKGEDSDPEDAINGEPREEVENDVSTVTISESKFNMVLSNPGNNLDLGDQLVMKSLAKGLKIRQIHNNNSTSDSEDDDDSLAPSNDEHNNKRFNRNNGRDSRLSRRSKRSRRSRKKYNNSNSESCDSHSEEDSSCNAELETLM